MVFSRKMSRKIFSKNVPTFLSKNVTFTMWSHWSYNPSFKPGEHEKRSEWKKWHHIGTHFGHHFFAKPGFKRCVTLCPSWKLKKTKAKSRLFSRAVVDGSSGRLTCIRQSSRPPFDPVCSCVWKIIATWILYVVLLNREACPGRPDPGTKNGASLGSRRPFFCVAPCSHFGDQFWNPGRRHFAYISKENLLHVPILGTKIDTQNGNLEAAN